MSRTELIDFIKNEEYVLNAEMKIEEEENREIMNLSPELQELSGKVAHNLFIDKSDDTESGKMILHFKKDTGYISKNIKKFYNFKVGQMVSIRYNGKCITLISDWKPGRKSKEHESIL